MKLSLQKCLDKLGVKSEKTKVLPLKNIMSVAEMEQALRDADLLD